LVKGRHFMQDSFKPLARQHEAKLNGLVSRLACRFLLRGARQIGT